MCSCTSWRRVKELPCDFMYGCCLEQVNIDCERLICRTTSPLMVNVVAVGLLKSLGTVNLQRSTCVRAAGTSRSLESAASLTFPEPSP